jgi:hypothetical protein
MEAYNEMVQRTSSGELSPEGLERLLKLLYVPEKEINAKVNELELQRAKRDAVRQKRLT